MNGIELEAWLQAHPDWTLTTLSEAIGMTPRSVQYWISGRYEIPPWVPIVLDGPPLTRRRLTGSRRRSRPAASRSTV
jgi:hypothetical protein